MGYQAIFLAAGGCAVLAAAAAQGAYLTVIGGPTNASVGGVSYETYNTTVYAGNGQAVSSFQKNDSTNSSDNTRAVRFDASGFTELSLLPTTVTVGIYGGAAAINDSGTVLGASTKYTGSTYGGVHAVRWAPNGTITELGNIGTDKTGFSSNTPVAMNGSGTGVGFAEKFDSGHHYLGNRAVRWPGTNNKVIELALLGTDGTGTAYSSALAINDAGVSVGAATKYSGGASLGSRPILWPASGTTPLELGTLGADPSGVSNGVARAINSSGISVGQTEQYDMSGSLIDEPAVRWDTSGNVSILASLPNTPAGKANGNATAINSSGVAVGTSDAYNASGKFLGRFATRWDAAGNATLLGNFGVAQYFENDYAPAGINDAGLAVGQLSYLGADGFYDKDAAVVWGADGVPIDLNTLIDPASGWDLINATSISNSGWIAGIGYYDDDGAGPDAAYPRAFVMEIPEPGGLLVFLAGSFPVAGRRFRA